MTRRGRPSGPGCRGGAALGVWAILIGAAALASASGASAAPAAPALANMPLYCKDSTGVLQFMKYVSFATLQAGYERKWGFKLFVDADQTVLTFAPAEGDPHFIRYSINHYLGEAGPGLGLLSMSVSMDNLHKTVEGTDMCVLTMENALN